MKTNNVLSENLVNILSSKVIPVFNLTKGINVNTNISMIDSGTRNYTTSFIFYFHFFLKREKIARPGRPCTDKLSSLSMDKARE